MIAMNKQGTVPEGIININNMVKHNSVILLRCISYIFSFDIFQL